MKTKHIFWGTLFISVGALILLNNFGRLNFYWDDLWQYWPVLIILLGVTIIVKDKIFKGLLAGVSGFILALFLFTLFTSARNVVTNNVVWDSDDFSISTDDSGNSQNFTEPYDSTVKDAYFHFESGAGAFFINSTTDDLFNAITRGSEYRFSTSKDPDSNNARLHLSMEDHRFTFRHGKLRNKAKISLNVNPVWDLDFEIGAASTNFDLTPYKIKKLDISMGAASLKLKLGDLYKENHVKIDGGASAIHVYLPENAGCDIETDISLSSRSFQGFKRLSNDHYRTDNFDSAEKKIYLRIETGVSSIKVSRESGW